MQPFPRLFGSLKPFRFRFPSPSNSLYRFHHAGLSSSHRVHLPGRSSRNFTSGEAPLTNVWRNPPLSGARQKAIDITKLGIRITHLALVALPMAIVVDTLIACYRDARRERRFCRAFRKGAVPSPEGYVVERKELEAKVKQILELPEGYGKYHLIVGVHGAGKTTLVRQVGHECSGIIYVSIPKDVSLFEESFSHAINWSLPIDSRSLLQSCARFLGIKEFEGFQGESFHIMFREFKRQAAIFKKEHCRPAVLVLDNIDHIAEKDPHLLLVLQDIAKESAYNQQFITVFVSSEGKALAQMERQSDVYSRGKCLEIGDLNEDESCSYLCKRQNKTEAEAREIYGLVGGRPSLLSAVSDKLAGGATFQVCKQEMFSLAENNLVRAGMGLSGKHRDIGLKVMEHILQHGSIHRRDYNLMVGGELGEKLLGFNVFSLSPNSAKVTFHSKLVENYVRMENALRKIQETGGNVLEKK